MSRCLFLTLFLFHGFGDWPVYKGNLYFTGNNDELVVQNNELKWTFLANAPIFNPVVSSQKIYFIDLEGWVYCVTEELGTLVWKVDLKKAFAMFKGSSALAGKVKYPLVKGETIILTDPVAIYALDIKTGQVKWARAALRPDEAKSSATGMSRSFRVDGIYSDPVLVDSAVFYGSRHMFLSREIEDGRLSWSNPEIKSYSAFPNYFDKYLLTQSRDYTKDIFELHLMERHSGKAKWKKSMPKPFKIFPPVVYKEDIYMPVGQILYALDLKTGNEKWKKDIGGIITSAMSFTDRSIIFTYDNRYVVVMDPTSGKVLKKYDLGKQAAPKFVTVRDMIYLGFQKKEGKESKSFIKAMNVGSGESPWSFQAPFAGGLSQASASGGILFFPAGPYLYAIGERGVGKNVDGSKSSIKRGGETVEKKIVPAKQKLTKGSTKKLSLQINDKDGASVLAELILRERSEDGGIQNEKKIMVDGEVEIEIPVDKDMEVAVSAEGYLPKRIEIVKEDNEKTKVIELDKIELNKSFIVDSVYFESGKAYLKKESLSTLRNLVKILMKNPSFHLDVRGHTDNVGSIEGNLILSRKRSESVVDYIIKHGISPMRLSSKGYGESQPIATNETKEGRAKNRRTEFYFSKE